LRRLWMEDNPDEGKIRAAQREIGELRERLAERRSAYHEGAISVMTAEQKREFGTRYPAWRDNMDHMPRAGGMQGRPFYGGDGNGRGMHRGMRERIDKRDGRW
jgi:Spy/CpxP family protein refolding chaperone